MNPTITWSTTRSGGLVLVENGKHTRYSTNDVKHKFDDGSKYWFLRSPNQIAEAIGCSYRSITSAISRGDIVISTVAGRRLIDVMYPENYKWMANVLNPSDKRKKAVLKLSMSGYVIKKYDGVRDAALSVRGSASHISRCCRGKATSAYGFGWRFW